MYTAEIFSQAPGRSTAPSPGRKILAAQSSISLGDVLAILRRRIVLVLTVAALVAAGTAAFVAFMPDVYVAKAVVYLDTASMPKSFERAGVTAPKLTQIIGTITEEV